MGMEQHSQLDEETPALTVDLFVRVSVVEEIEDQITEVIDELRTLETSGIVDELCVRTWHRRVPVNLQFDENAAGINVLAKYDEFSTWAADNGYSLPPFFAHRLSKESEYLVLPIMCLSIYGPNGTLEAVYPYANGDVTYSVEDGLKVLATRNDRGDRARVEISKMDRLPLSK